MDELEKNSRHRKHVSFVRAKLTKLRQYGRQFLVRTDTVKPEERLKSGSTKLGEIMVHAVRADQVRA